MGIAVAFTKNSNYQKNKVSLFTQKVEKIPEIQFDEYCGKLNLYF